MLFFFFSSVSFAMLLSEYFLLIVPCILCNLLLSVSIEFLIPDTISFSFIGCTFVSFNELYHVSEFLCLLIYFELNFLYGVYNNLEACFHSG